MVQRVPGPAAARQSLCQRFSKRGLGRPRGSWRVLQAVLSKMRVSSGSIHDDIMTFKCFISIVLNIAVENKEVEVEVELKLVQFEVIQVW